MLSAVLPLLSWMRMFWPCVVASEYRRSVAVFWSCTASVPVSDRLRVWLTSDILMSADPSPLMLSVTASSVAPDRVTVSVPSPPSKRMSMGETKPSLKSSSSESSPAVPVTRT